MNHAILQELAVMKQVLISMRSRQGDALNLLETNKAGIRTSGAGKHQSKRISRTTEEESPNKPKPTVFVSVLTWQHPRMSHTALTCPDARSDERAGGWQEMTFSFIGAFHCGQLSKDML